MHLTIIHASKEKLRFDRQFTYIAKIFEQEIGVKKGILNVIFCDDGLMRTLNRSHRGKDSSTNVLTFTHEASSKTPNDLLAEIYLDVPYIKKQAKVDVEAFSTKMFTLFIHGLLHSRGYDHEKNEDYRIMKLLEVKILRRFLASSFS